MVKVSILLSMYLKENRQKMNKMKIFLRSICWLKEVYYTILYNISISGHEYESEHVGYESAFLPLKCKICNKISK